MIDDYILAKSIIAIVKKMKADWKKKQKVIKIHIKLKVLTILKLLKISAEAAKKLHNSQVETIKRLYKSQVKLACIPTDKVVSKLIDRYVKNDRLLVKRLEIMKNKNNILIFIFLSKVFIIPKHWLVIKYNK